MLHAFETHVPPPPGPPPLPFRSRPGISGPGYMIVGYLSDRYPLIYVLLTCCVGSALSCFFLWGFGTTNAVMIVFVLFFGLLAPSITALWSGMISIIARECHCAPLAPRVHEQAMTRCFRNSSSAFSPSRAAWAISPLVRAHSGRSFMADDQGRSRTRFCNTMCCAAKQARMECTTTSVMLDGTREVC